MEHPTNEQITASVYEPPILVEVGEFSENTLGASGIFHDFSAHQNSPD